MTASPKPDSGNRYKSAFRPGMFEDQVVIVTGGGSGLGRCTAHELTSLGASVVLVGRTLSKLEIVRDELTQDYPESAERIHIHACDIRDEPKVRELVAEVVNTCGRIHGLFNCAGGQFPAPLEKISLNGWDAVVRNNLHGTFLMSRECYVQSMRDHGGTIVNMLADIWGGMPGMGHSGVRVNAVAPGWIASAGMDSYDAHYQALLRELKHKVPLQRFGTEAELSSAAVFLLSEAAAFINGSVIRVDGGVPNARHSWPLAAAERTIEYNGFPRYRAPAGLQN